MLEMQVRRMDPDIDLPRYARAGDAGADLFAAEDAVIEPGGGRALIRTGLAVAIPAGYAGFIQPRSGLALRHGITCLNTPGLIDSGYREELKVLLLNTDAREPFKVGRGDRIAQLVVQAVERVEFVECSELPELQTDEDAPGREGGFGHTGT